MEMAVSAMDNDKLYTLHLGFSFLEVSYHKMQRWHQCIPSVLKNSISGLNKRKQNIGNWQAVYNVS